MHGACAAQKQHPRHDGSQSKVSRGAPGTRVDQGAHSVMEVVTEECVQMLPEVMVRPRFGCGVTLFRLRSRTNSSAKLRLACGVPPAEPAVMWSRPPPGEPTPLRLSSIANRFVNVISSPLVGEEPVIEPAVCLGAFAPMRVPVLFSSCANRVRNVDPADCGTRVGR